MKENLLFFSDVSCSSFLLAIILFTDSNEESRKFKFFLYSRPLFSLYTFVFSGFIEQIPVLTMDDSSVDPQRRKKATPSECKICGAPAIYSYCGVISCRPCNVFFRRYAVQKKVNWKRRFTLEKFFILFRKW